MREFALRIAHDRFGENEKMKLVHSRSTDFAAANRREIGYQPASIDIWDKKYRLKSKDGRAIDEDIDETYRRVARALADV